MLFSPVYAYDVNKPLVRAWRFLINNQQGGQLSTNVSHKAVRSTPNRKVTHDGVRDLEPSSVSITQQASHFQRSLNLSEPRLITCDVGISAMPTGWQWESNKDTYENLTECSQRSTSWLLSLLLLLLSVAIVVWQKRGNE